MATTIQSVERSSRLLLAVTRTPGGLTAAEAAERFGLSLSTAVHLLGTLTAEGLLAKAEGRRYVLGPAAGEIANAVVEQVRPPDAFVTALHALAAETRETAYLTGWHLGRVRILASVEGAQAVRVAGLEPGFSDSVHARASAKLLLAHAEPALRESVLAGHEFVAHTPATLRSRAALDAELDRIRAAAARGELLVHDREEYREGVHSLSAPLFQGGRVTAALAVSAPADRFDRTEPALTAALSTRARSARA